MKASSALKHIHLFVPLVKMPLKLFMGKWFVRNTLGFYKHTVSCLPQRTGTSLLGCRCTSVHQPDQHRGVQPLLPRQEDMGWAAVSELLGVLSVWMDGVHIRGVTTEVSRTVHVDLQGIGNELSQTSCSLMLTKLLQIIKTALG